MIGSLLIKLGMLALTMGMMFWIGWTVPQDQTSERMPAIERSQTAHAKRTDASPIPAPAAATVSTSRTSEQSKTSPKSRAAIQLDLNRATEQDFESLPGIGPVLAGRIVKHRQEIGSFHSVEDLREVKGIGKKKFDRIRNRVHVTMPIPPAREGKKTT